MGAARTPGATRQRVPRSPVPAPATRERGRDEGKPTDAKVHRSALFLVPTPRYTASIVI
jgi:hypothetical protein